MGLRIGFLAVAVAAACAAGCGPHALPPLDVAPRVAWWDPAAEPDRVVRNPSYPVDDGFRAAAVAIAGPGFVREDDRLRPAAFVNLLESGSAQVGAREYPPWGNEDRERDVRLLEDALRGWNRHDAAPKRSLVVLHADHRAAWSSIDGWLSRIAWDAVAIRGLSFAVEHYDLGLGRIDVTLRPAGDRAGVRVRLARSDDALRVEVGTRTWGFASGAPYAAGPSLVAANAAWHEILEVLRAERSRDGGIATIAIDPRAPWSHVVHLFSLAILAGFEVVQPDGRGYALALTAPRVDPLHPWITAGRPLGQRDPRDWQPLPAIGIGVGLATLFVLLTSRHRRVQRRVVR